jgi:hypothetical protein
MPLDGSDRLSSPSVSRNVSFMSAKSSTSSAPGDRCCRDDAPPSMAAVTASGTATGGLSRAKSVKRSSMAGGAKTTQNQALLPRTATVITGGRGYVHRQVRLGAESDTINGVVGGGLLEGGCLVVWNQKLQ